MRETRDQPARESGFSLVEVIIALGLFSLISMAGFGLVSSILDVQTRMAGRLERLGDLQRAMHLLTSDIQQAEPRSLKLSPDGLSLRRGATLSAPALEIRYGVADGSLARVLDERKQELAEGVTGIHWRALTAGGGSTDVWPAPGGSANVAVLAVEATIALSDKEGVVGELRRIVELPEPG